MANKKKTKSKKNNNINNNNKYNKKNNSNNNRKQAINNRQKSNESSISSTDFKLKNNKSNDKKSNNSLIDVFGDCDQRINIELNENQLEFNRNEDKTNNKSKSDTNSMQEICDKSKQLVNNSPNFSIIESPKGLTNLGNTCFFNSVLQVVSQTHVLYELLNERSNSGFIWRAKSLRNLNECHFERQFDEEIDVILPNCMSLTNSLIGLMREMRSQNNSKTLNPSKLLNDIRKDWSQFSGWAQQDSHELLRCLIDSLKCKEIIRQKRAILNELNCKDNVDDDTKARIKSFATYSCHTIIDSVFGGQLLSSVSCDECHFTNQILEPFFDLSLPLSQPKDNSVIIRDEAKVKAKKPIEEKCLLEEDSKNLTPRERKIKRQQKKAAKRVDKQQKKMSETKLILDDNKDQCNGIKASIDEKSSQSEDNVEQTCAQNDNNEKTNDNNCQFDDSTDDNDFKVDEDWSNNTVCEADDWTIEPLLNDCNDCGAIDSKSSNSEQNNDDKKDGEEDEEFDFHLLFDSVDNDIDWAQNSDEIPLDYNLVKPDFIEEDNEWCSDETKAHLDSDFGLTDLENELLMLNISDKEKLSLKQTDYNSSHMKSIIKSTLEPISTTNELPNFALMSLLSNFTSIESLSGNNKYLCEMCTKNNGGNKTFNNASKKSLIAIPPPILTLHLKRFEAEGYRKVSLKKINSYVSFPARFDLSPFTSNLYNLMTPLTGLKKTNAIIYSLYGVIEHSGTLRSGHYTAFVKMRPNSAKNVRKFALLEPFISKVENVLKMIENNYLSQSVMNEDNNCHNGINGDLSNGCINGSNDETITEEEANDCGKWYHISDTCVSSSSLSSVLRSQAYILFYERIV
jgi:ubiquitin carboxyl-terminal hydrolase 16/45